MEDAPVGGAEDDDVTVRDQARRVDVAAEPLGQAARTTLEVRRAVERPSIDRRPRAARPGGGGDQDGIASHRHRAEVASVQAEGAESPEPAPAPLPPEPAAAP